MRIVFLLIFSMILFPGCESEKNPGVIHNIRISFAETVADSPKDGRLLLMFSNDASAEPRFQIGAGLNTQLIFGMNVDGMQPGTAATFDADALGFPYESLSEIPPGEYQVQALLHTYETFNLSTGHTVKLPMDNGEGQQWNQSPGNLYSKPFSVTISENGITGLEVRHGPDHPSNTRTRRHPLD